MNDKTFSVMLVNRKYDIIKNKYSLLTTKNLLCYYIINGVSMKQIYSQIYSTIPIFTKIPIDHLNSRLYLSQPK